MSITLLFQRATRRLQGERRGMGSELKPPTPEMEALIFTLQPELIFAPTIVIQQLVRLADVSFWQGVIDFVRMRAAGVAGVIIRAGQNAWQDLKFKINWVLAKLAGMPRGSYWFYDSRKDPKEQAALWWSLIESDTGELCHVADFEESYGGPFGRKSDFKTFLTHFQYLSKLPDDQIVIYTGFFWWIERIGDDLFFRRYQLWLASYGSMQSARIPAPWSASDLLFWQYTASGDGSLYGVSSLEIDMNWFCCDQSAYTRRFPLVIEGVPMPDPTGYIFKITPTGSYVSIRTEPDTGNTPLTTRLLAGQYAYGNRRLEIAEDKYEGGIQVNKAGDIWLEVTLINGATYQIPLYIAEIHKGERVATITQIGVIPNPNPLPTPTLPDLPVSIVLGDDVTYSRQVVNVVLKPKA